MNKKILSFLSLFWLLTACASGTPVQVKLNYAPENKRLKAALAEEKKVNLRMTKMEFLDKRENQQTIGATDASIYGTGGINEWVRSGIVSLSEFGYTFSSPEHKTNSKDVSLNVIIHRASCRGMMMHLRCTVLIEVAFFTGGAFSQKKTYYGTQVEEKSIISADYSHFEESAVQSGLNGALEHFLVQFEADLRKLAQ